MRALVTVDERDPKRTEEFLMAQDDVVDASVWVDGHELRAHVTLAADAHWDTNALREACTASVGLKHTPSDFLLIRHRARRG